MKRCSKDFIRTLGLSGLIIAAASVSAVAQKKYDPGVTDTEIKIGNIMPYSGPASAYGIIGKTMSAYFRMINDNGSISGRKVHFIYYDDQYDPAQTPIARRKPWSRHASWSKATRCSSSCRRSAPRATPRSRNT